MTTIRGRDLRGTARARMAIALLAVLGLLAGCRSNATAHRGKAKLPWYTSEIRYEPGYAIHPLGAFMPAPDSKKFAGKRSFDTVVLKNEYLRVEVAPEAGGAIYRAIYRPTGDDLFFYEGKAKDWLPYWESGVKVSFPYREHGVATIQPASYRVLQRDDGSATVAMWMEFSRFHEPYHATFYGRHSAMLLSQHVTIRPGEGWFEVTYRIVNPAPYRQGRQIWNDAFFPRNHTRRGAVQADAQPPAETTTEFILPAAYVSNHSGRDFRKFDESHTPLAIYTEPHTSIFTWDIPYGFAGMWYPQVKVNRLRLFDPGIAPGVKLFLLGDGSYKAGTLSTHCYNFTEIWGGFDNIFEGVENWIGPGQAYQFTHRFAFIKGIGKVDYANNDVAVNVEFGGNAPQVEAVTLRPVEKLTAALDGEPLGGSAPCAPDRPARFALPAGTTAGRLVLTANGRVILDQQFPLHVPNDTSDHDRIRDCLKHSGRRYELNDCGGEAWYRSAIGRYPKGSTGRGRVLYRDGQLDKAIECLQEAVRNDPADGEAWHLLAAALLEAGLPADAKITFDRAATAGKPYAPAWYFCALTAIANNDTAGAAQMLGKLVRADPRNWEGRLLKAYLEAHLHAARRQALTDALALGAEDPADPRAQFVLAHCARAAGDENLAAQAETALEQLMKEPGAETRLKEFEAATRGEYKPPKRLQPAE